MILFAKLKAIKNTKKGELHMYEVYDSYFDYSFDCEVDIIDKNESTYSNQIRAFNGGGSGG